MSGSPMRLMIDSNADPVAFQSPVPIALHWQDEVKAGLDQDVRLGVLEPVPVGTPVTWCHRMVICAKKTGNPTRTVDFQPLNAHATREMHLIQTPFHQARSVPHGTLKSVSLERIPQRAITCRRHAFHHLHHPVGPLQVLLCYKATSPPETDIRDAMMKLLLAVWWSQDSYESGTATVAFPDSYRVRIRVCY